MSELNIEFSQNALVTAVLILQDGGDGALAYSQSATIKLDSGTWDSETINGFIADVADAMVTHFGYSKPYVRLVAYEGGKHVFSGKVDV